MRGQGDRSKGDRRSSPQPSAHSRTEASAQDQEPPDSTYTAWGQTPCPPGSVSQIPIEGKGEGRAGTKPDRGGVSSEVREPHAGKHEGCPGKVQPQTRLRPRWHAGRFPHLPGTAGWSLWGPYPRGLGFFGRGRRIRPGGAERRHLANPPTRPSRESVQ